MIGYVTLGTNELAKAAAFYDELFSVIGASRVYEGDNFVAWSTGPGAPAVSSRNCPDGPDRTVPGSP